MSILTIYQIDTWESLMAEQKMLHGRKQDLRPEKYGKLKLIKLYLWSAELRQNQLQSKILKKDCSQKIPVLLLEIL